MTQLSRNKFANLTPEHQHSLSCKFLRRIFASADSIAIKIYADICAWLQLRPIDTTDRQELTDRFHWHHHRTKKGLHESHYLLKNNSVDSQQPKASSLPVDVYLDKLRSAHNVGSILRTVDAFHLGTVYFSKEMCTVDNQQVQAAAMGTEQWVPTKVIDGPSKIQSPLYALETSEEGLSVFDFVFPNTFTLALGNEEYGCSTAVLHEADQILYLPMYGRKNSLNVANAFASVAAEIRRQHDLKQQKEPIHG